MWYGTVGDMNVILYFWGQEMWYDNFGDRKCGTVMLGTRNVVQ
jgi:hypothetical protein